MKAQPQKSHRLRNVSVGKKHLTFYSFLKLVAFKPALNEGGEGEQVTQELALRQPVPELA